MEKFKITAKNLYWPGFGESGCSLPLEHTCDIEFSFSQCPLSEEERKVLTHISANMIGDVCHFPLSYGKWRVGNDMAGDFLEKNELRVLEKLAPYALSSRIIELNPA